MVAGVPLVRDGCQWYGYTSGTAATGSSHWYVASIEIPLVRLPRTRVSFVRLSLVATPRTGGCHLATIVGTVTICTAVTGGYHR